MKQLAIAPKVLVQSPSGLLPAESTSGQSPSYATLAAARLLSLYRKADANNPEAYLAGIAAIFSEYPADVIDVACDPRTGIVRRVKWLPTIAEVSEFCEELMRPRREEVAYRERVRAQIAEREAVFGKPVHGKPSNPHRE